MCRVVRNAIGKSRERNGLRIQQYSLIIQYNFSPQIRRGTPVRPNDNFTRCRRCAYFTNVHVNIVSNASNCNDLSLDHRAIPYNITTLSTFNVFRTVRSHPYTFLNFILEKKKGSILPIISNFGLTFWALRVAAFYTALVFGHISRV